MYSMSMEERGEVPDGMSGIIRYESLLASALWHSASPKKAPDAPISRRASGTPSRNRALIETYLQNFGIPQAQVGIFAWRRISGDWT